MTKEELATERNEVREILECFSEELSQANLNELSRVFCLINGDEKRIAELETRCNELFLQTCEQAELIEKMKCCYNCSKWNDGECEESPKSKTFFCADFKCDNWEMFK